MATATIIFTDEDDDGTVDVKITFDPAVSRSTDTLTPAQHLAFLALQAAHKGGDE